MVSTNVFIFIIIASAICVLSIAGRTLYQCRKSTDENMKLLEQNIDVQIF